jgi:hypothetical protein
VIAQVTSTGLNHQNQDGRLVTYTTGGRRDRGTRVRGARPASSGRGSVGSVEPESAAPGSEALKGVGDVIGSDEEGEVVERR